MRTKEEIAAEIKALKALKPAGPFKEDTKRSIALCIEELQFGVDQTADEFDDLSEAEQDLVQQVWMWKHGRDDGCGRPSDGWGGLVE